MSRYVFFSLMVIIGIATGLMFAWVVAAPDVGDTSPDTLRLDYKADYVLMIAEIYDGDHDLRDARERLGHFTQTTPLELVDEVIAFASQYGYAPGDLLLMRTLSVDLQSQDAEVLP